MIEPHYDIVSLVSNDLNTDRRMIRSCKALVAQGYKVLLIGRELPKSKSLNAQDFDQFRVKCTFNKGVFFYLELIIRLSSVLRRLSYQKLLCVDLDTVLCSQLVKKGNRVFYLDLHEYFVEVPELKGKWIKKKVWKIIEKMCVSSFDVIYTVNDSLSDIFSNSWNREVGVIKNVPLLNELIQGQVNQPIESVYLGVLNPGRGLAELLDSILGRSDIRLTLIGDGPLRKQLEAKASGAENIVFTGSLEPMQISSLLSKMDLGWNLLNNNSLSYYYSLANKFFDYVHHGLPVVTMDFPEYRSLVNQFNCGILISDLSKVEIDSAIEQMITLGNTKKWSALLGNCLRIARTHNWQIESKKLIDLFED